jgi:hypothetical protein
MSEKDYSEAYDMTIIGDRGMGMSYKSIENAIIVNDETQNKLKKE